ncbi:MAG TPA: DUF2950 domain-containing protein [Terriglobia bacterium]|nr:DUF2950 domain-containing protein [Terriglobia bacterium]
MFGPTKKRTSPRTFTFGAARSVHINTMVFALATSLILLVPAIARRGAQQPPPHSGPAQETFASAQDAASAFIEAVDKYDVASLKKILGPEGTKLVESKDPVQDKNRAEHFARMAEEKHTVVFDPHNAQRGYLVVGDNSWPWPVPIVERDGRWLFDTPAGIREVLYRRIGANELDAIEICRGYVEAQRDYALVRHDGSEVNQYAQRIISTPGTHDGLIWHNLDGSIGGAAPISEPIAKALQQGYTDRSQPYHGYYFKILKGQGPDAPLGQLDFVVNGAMIGGFALAAAPAEYRVTGVKTFIVSYEGIVYQKDLGPNTLSIFQEMTLYNPDKTWKPTNDNWPSENP